MDTGFSYNDDSTHGSVYPTECTTIRGPFVVTSTVHCTVSFGMHVRMYLFL